MVHKIISTLLALQLLVSFGLCGGLCCGVQVKAARQMKGSRAKAELLKPDEAKPSEAAAASHCPLHGHKAATAQSRQASGSTTHQTKSEAKAGATLRKADCCIYRGNAPEAEPAQVATTLQSHKHFAVSQAAFWRAELTAQSPTVSPPKSDLSAPPPHAGFQLSLRI